MSTTRDKRMERAQIIYLTASKDAPLCAAYADGVAHGVGELAAELLAHIEAWRTSDPMRTAASALLDIRKLLLAASAGEDAQIARCAAPGCPLADGHFGPHVEPRPDHVCGRNLFGRCPQCGLKEKP